MTIPIHELAALATATCWATTGLIAADAVRALGAFHFNLWRQGFVTLGAYTWGGEVLASASFYFYGDDASAMAKAAQPEWEAWFAALFT